MGSWQMKRKKKLHGMIGPCHLISFKNSSDFKEKGTSTITLPVTRCLEFFSLSRLCKIWAGGGGGKTSCVMGDV